MKKFLSALAALSLLFACTPEENGADNNQSGNGVDKIVHVTGISLDRNSATIKEGESITLVVTVTPANADNKEVNWSSSSDAVATVDASGKVTGVKAGSATITAITADGGMKASCALSVEANLAPSVTVYVTSIRINKTSLSLEIGDEVTLSVTILPDNANDKSYTWSSSDSSIASVDNSGKVTARANGNATIKATANDGSGVFASCSVEVYRINVPQAVDMGTVVNGKNIKWASFNIGASSPEEYGLYYAWGETEPKENYSWSTYKFGKGSAGPFSKYNTISSLGSIDNKTVLEPEDDVASVKLGGKWRMPTDAEWGELRTKCTWTWTTNYNGTRVRGRIVTASNGNSIFLPATGYRNATYRGGVGSGGDYWSSSLHTGYPYNAWNVYFDSADVRRYPNNRCGGQSVRPVSE